MKSLNIPFNAFREALDHKHFCPACSQLSWRPAEFDNCGHKSCFDCISELCEDGLEGVCPTCKRHGEITPDIESEMELKAKLVECFLCHDWVGKASDLEHHVKSGECAADSMTCPLFRVGCCSENCTVMVRKDVRFGHACDEGNCAKLIQKIHQQEQENISVRAEQVITARNFDEAMESEHTILRHRITTLKNELKNALATKQPSPAAQQVSMSAPSTVL